MAFIRDFLHFGTAAAGVAAFTLGAHAFTESASASERTCQPVQMSLYFSPGESDLNAFAERLVSTAADKLGGCEIARIEATGYADASGAATLNQTLSEARVNAVIAALEKKGVTSNQIDVKAFGETGAVDSDGDTVPMRRKADVQIFPVTSTVS